MTRTAMAAAGDAVTPAMLDRYDRDLHRFEREGGYAAAARIDAVLHGLGFDPDRARTQAIASLSGGERGRVALARQLAAPADLLLLDEPTNDLDIPTLEVLEESLLEFPGALVLVTHDRYLLDRVSTRLLALDGRGGAVAYADYDQWEQGRRSAVQHEQQRGRPRTPPKPAQAPWPIRIRRSGSYSIPNTSPFSRGFRRRIFDGTRHDPLAVGAVGACVSGAVVVALATLVGLGWSQEKQESFKAVRQRMEQAKPGIQKNVDTVFAEKHKFLVFNRIASIQ